MGALRKAIYHPLCMCHSQPQLVLSHTQRSPKWAVFSQPLTSDVLALHPPVLRRHSDVQTEIRSQRTVCYRPPAALWTTMATSGKTERQRGNGSSGQTSRQELWERAWCDMWISFCKLLEPRNQATYSAGGNRLTSSNKHNIWINSTRIKIYFENFLSCNLWTSVWLCWTKPCFLSFHGFLIFIWDHCWIIDQGKSVKWARLFISHEGTVFSS